MLDQRQMQVFLLPDGRVAIRSADADPVAPGATWENLGSVRQVGQRMAFVRAEIAGESWASLVSGEWLDQDRTSPLVTLTRQTQPHPPLTGWSRFC